MLFSTQWRKLMQSKSVEEQIIHGTMNGVPLSEVRCKPIDKLALACLILNSGNENDLKTTQSAKMLRILNHQPFVIYYLRNLPIPVGIQNPHIPFTVAALPDLDNLQLIQERIPGWADRVALNIWDGVPAEPVADNTARLCNSIDHMICQELLEANYLKAHYVSYETEKNALIAKNPLGLTYLNTDFEIWLQRLSASQTAEFGKQVEIGLVNLGKANDELISENNRCSYVFSKLGTNATSMAKGEIERREWHAAYTIINAKYLEKGIGDISVFEEKVKAVIMEKGQPLQEHIARLQEALCQWATVQFLANESIRLMGNMNHASINTPECNANAGSLTDAEITALGFTVLISHAKRYDIYEKSVRHVERFSSIIGSFKQLPYHQKLVATFLEGLENIEKSNSGMDDFRKEVEGLNSSNPDKKRVALQVSTTGPAKKSSELHSCKFHPGREVYHLEKDCSLNPVNNKGKNNGSSAAATSKKSVTAPCPYCLKHNPTLALYHGEEKCWHNPSSPAYNKSKANPSGSKTPKSSAKSAGMSADFVERVGKMEGNIIKSLVAQLSNSSSSSASKKRKGVQSEDEETN